MAGRDANAMAPEKQGAVFMMWMCRKVEVIQKGRSSQFAKF
jgi:hypothetical protein